MPDPTLEEIMILYARRGLQDWKEAPSELRQRARKYLANRIADDEPQANITLTTIFNGNNAEKLQFIPMPISGDGSIERCFFLPIQEINADGSRKFSFDLFLLVAKRDCLAFRFETGDAVGNHTYTHVQFCKTLVRKSMQIEPLLKWIPDSYPAFPLATSSPLGLFFTMAVTVHGYLDGLVTLLSEIFMAANQSNDYKRYATELKTTLNC